MPDSQPLDDVTAPTEVRPDETPAKLADPGSANDTPALPAAPPAFVRPPGPGIPEALLWTIGFFVVQIIGLIVMVPVVVAWHGANQGLDSVVQNFGSDPEFFPELLQTYHVPMFVGVEAFVVFAALLATALRLGRQTPRRLGLGLPPERHIACILLLVLPMYVLSTGLYVRATDGWKVLVDQMPSLKFFEDVQSIEFVKQLADETSLGALLLVIAVAPAIAEEVVFRGVIGRGLVARWGMSAGVLMTSVLFAAAHVFPPHAFALIPLAILMHVAYLATRSFWAPVLIHFLNNGFSAVLVKSESKLLQHPLFSDDGPPLWIFVASFACWVSVLALLWATRVEFRLFDGSVWNPGYLSAEVPPRSEQTTRRCRSAPGWLVLAAVLSLAAFVGACLQAGVVNLAD